MYNLRLLPDTIVANILGRGITDLTPVQDAVLMVDDPAGDTLVSARTGSGKTVAYGVALARRLMAPGGLLPAGPGPRALVITPTRELAAQVRGELAWLFLGSGLRIGACTGGSDVATERAELSSGLEIVVGTPGRLRDHIAHGGLNAERISCLVLDEADVMLDLGFREDLEAILVATPEKRQTLMFSATITPRIEALASRFQVNAQRVTVCSDNESVDVTFQAIIASEENRDKAVVNVLCLWQPDSALVFCSRRTTAAAMARHLTGRGFNAVELSGDLRQVERDAAVASMRDGRARVCVATDVAARGLDLPGLDLVIHAELPSTGETLLHRSGRTGRAGRKGQVVLIVPPALRQRATLLAVRARILLKWVPAPRREDIERLERERLLLGLRATTPPVDAREIAAAERILAEQTPEQVAAAFVKLWSLGRPAMEEFAPPTPKKRDPAAVARGVWFSVNCGGGHKAEVVSILPRLCRLGNVKREDIGIIRVLVGETRFEVRAAVARKFAAAAAEQGGGLCVRRLGAGAALRRKRSTV